jgi:hypothetical protein
MTRTLAAGAVVAVALVGTATGAWAQGLIHHAEIVRAACQ